MHNGEHILPRHTRLQAKTSEDDVWTSARCNRLLRSLNSRIIALRKATQQCALSQRCSAPAKPKRRVRHSDPSWIPCQQPLKSARTYKGKPSTKVSHTEQKSASASRTVLPSPFVRRIKEHETFPTQTAINYGRKTSIRKNKCITMQSGIATATTEQKLVLAFASLLSNTAREHIPVRSGARSLFDMCSRKVPSLLTLDSDDFEFGRAHGISEETASIYTYLEGEFESNRGRGAPMLRRVVRAHGVVMVCNAINENLLSDLSIHDLVRACHTDGAMDDGSAILRTWLTASTTISQKKFVILAQFCEYHDTQLPLIQTLSSTLGTDLDGITAFKQHVKFASLIPSCLEGHHSATLSSSAKTSPDTELRMPMPEAARFLADLIDIAAGATHPEDRLQAASMSGDLQNTASTIALMALGIRWSMTRATWQMGILEETIFTIAGQAIIQQKIRSKQPPRRNVSMEGRTISPNFGILGHGNQDVQSNDVIPTAMGNSPFGVEMPFVFTALILLALRDDGTPTYGALSIDMLASYILAPSRRLLGQKRRLHPATTDFIHHFGRSVATFDRISGADLGLKLLTRLTQAAQYAEPAVKTLLKALAMEVATHSSAADSSNRTPMARKVTTMMQSHDDTVDQAGEQLGERKMHYRWEDGLCEWVTATPRPTMPATPSSAERRGCKRKLQSEPCSPDVLALSPIKRRQRHSFPSCQPLLRVERKRSERISSVRSRSLGGRSSIDQRIYDQYSDDELGSKV